MSWFSRLRASRAEIASEDLRSLLAGIPATPISAARAREQGIFAGTILALTYQPDGGIGLRAHLDDGTGAITLIFLGRREIPGIELGRRLTASGVVALLDGLPVIYNPEYELLPGVSE